jgi:hypothetical protein
MTQLVFSVFKLTLIFISSDPKHCSSGKETQLVFAYFKTHLEFSISRLGSETLG